MIYRILKMEIFYIYRKLLFYFILLPKTLMFSLSEYLSRRQPGAGGGEGREGLGISSEEGGCPYQWWLSGCQWAVLSQTRRGTPSVSWCCPPRPPPRTPRGTSCPAPWLLCPSLDPPASNKYHCWEIQIIPCSSVD